jgi:hypothetical protein
MWWTNLAFALVTISGIAAFLIFYGRRRWKLCGRKLYAGIEAARSPVVPRSYNLRELEDVPDPVNQYFRTVINQGQPLILAVDLKHSGSFNLGQRSETWRRFRSTQRVITQRPGFVWDARICMIPPISVYVRDAYLLEKGVLIAKLLGLLKVMGQPSTPALAQAELMRFLAEAVWYPTALLPSQGVVWTTIDERHAWANLTDGTTTVSLSFQFNNDGLVTSVRSDKRYRVVDGNPVATPWQGRFWDYTDIDGTMIPLEGEVAWLLPGGAQPYWRGRIQHVEYEYSR